MQADQTVFALPTSVLGPVSPRLLPTTILTFWAPNQKDPKHKPRPESPLSFALHSLSFSQIIHLPDHLKICCDFSCTQDNNSFELNSYYLIFPIPTIWKLFEPTTSKRLHSFLDCGKLLHKSEDRLGRRQRIHGLLPVLLYRWSLRLTATENHSEFR